MKAVIMAGGKGTRIARIRSDVPKPMIELCGKPILLRQIENLRESGISDIRIVTGHLGGAITGYFGDGEKFGASISYFNETEPLGTAGALFQMQDLREDFLLLCGDVVFDIDFDRFINFHRSNDALATLATHPNSHPFDSSLIVTETLPPKAGDVPIDSNVIVKWTNKEDERVWYKNRVNAGIEIISPELLDVTRKFFAERSEALPRKIDLDRDVLKPAVKTHKIFSYSTTEYIKDMGTPERYRAAEDDIKNGIVARKNLSRKQRAVFLDRDGVINKNVPFISRPEQMELLPRAAQAIKKINDSGFLAVVVTNQSVIARGDATFDGLREIHDKMETLLGLEGAYVDAIYFCPHHKDSGFAGERAEYKFDCACRKPKPGLIQKAAREMNIDVSRSFMVGDDARDVECGENARCMESVLLRDGYDLLDFADERF